MCGPDLSTFILFNILSCIFAYNVWHLFDQPYINLLMLNKANYLQREVLLTTTDMINDKQLFLNINKL